jgi:hypothetical protein
VRGAADGDDIIASELLYDEAAVAICAAALHRLLIDRAAQ